MIKKYKNIQLHVELMWVQKPRGAGALGGCLGAPQRGVCDGELGAEGGGRSILQGQSVFSDFVGITTKYSNMCASLKNAYIQ